MTEATTDDTITSSRTEALMKRVRQTGLFRDLVPMEAGIGWPIPYRSRDSGRAYLILSFFGMSPTVDQGVTALFAPFSGITLDWLNGHPVQYVDYRFHSEWAGIDFSRPVGTFPHDAVRNLTRKEYLDKRADLLLRYDVFMDTLAAGRELPPFWIREFAEALNLLIEPGLRSFYAKLGPKFYEQFVVGEG